MLVKNQKKLVLKKDSGKVYATITHDEVNEWIFIDWNGFLKVDLVKEGSERLLEMFKKVGDVKKILVSNVNVSGPWHEANGWYETDWNPRAIKAGLNYMAVVVSSNLFTQLSLKGFEELNPGYSVKNFQSISQAEKWLASQQ